MDRHIHYVYWPIVLEPNHRSFVTYISNFYLRRCFSTNKEKVPEELFYYKSIFSKETKEEMIMHVNRFICVQLMLTGLSNFLNYDTVQLDTSRQSLHEADNLSNEVSYLGNLKGEWYSSWT